MAGRPREWSLGRLFFRLLSGAWSDSRAGIDLCKTRATNAINVGLRPEMLNFNQLVSP
jgi:hypothetical protein